MSVLMKIAGNPLGSIAEGARSLASNPNVLKTVGGTVLGGTFGRLSSRRRPGESEQEFQARRRSNTMKGAVGGAFVGGFGDKVYNKAKEMVSANQAKNPDAGRFVDTEVKAPVDPNNPHGRRMTPEPATAVSGEVGFNSDKRNYTKEDIRFSDNESKKIDVNFDPNPNPNPNPNQAQNNRRGSGGGVLKQLGSRLNKKINPYSGSINVNMRNTGISV